MLTGISAATAVAYAKPVPAQPSGGTGCLGLPYNLLRVFAVDVMTCPRYDLRMQRVAVIQQPKVAVRRVPTGFFDIPEESFFSPNHLSEGFPRLAH